MYFIRYWPKKTNKNQTIFGKVLCSQTVSILINTLSVQECSNIFSKGGGEELAKLTGSAFLGETNEIVLHVKLACWHKVSQHTANAHHSSATIHDLGGILRHCHATKMVDPDFSAAGGLKFLDEGNVTY